MTSRSCRSPRSTPFLFALGALALCATWLAGEAAASTVRALSLQALTEKAELIVVGTALEAKTRHALDGKLLVTDVRVRVERVLLGAAKPDQPLVVTLLGGEQGGVQLNVPGEASLPLGKRALLFLYRAPKSADLRVVGMSQGVMPIEQKPDGTTMVIPGGAGGALVDRGSDGKLHPAPAALMQPEPMDALLARVERLVAAQ